MEERQRHYIIPENFIDEERVLNGIFKLKNLIEGLCFAGVILIPALILTKDQEFTTRIGSIVAICGPFFLLGYIGFNGDSTVFFIRRAFNWLKTKSIVLYDTNITPLTMSPIDAMAGKEEARDKILDIVDAAKENYRKKAGEKKYVEGETFEFAKDKDLKDIQFAPKEVEILEEESFEDETSKFSIDTSTKVYSLFGDTSIVEDVNLETKSVNDVYLEIEDELDLDIDL